MPRRILIPKYGVWVHLPRSGHVPRLPAGAWQGQGQAHPAYREKEQPRKGEDEDEKGGVIRKFLENGATTLAALLMLGLAGYSYHVFYKRLVLRKMDNAFSPGFSTLELAALAQHGYDHENEGKVDDDEEHKFRITRPEQSMIDAIVRGSVRGNYYLLFGEKGTGKTSMLLESMRKVQGDGVGMLEAHGDVELFRLRLGKALDYEYHEDYIGGMFNIRGPRDATPLLDIERALNKLEKVALNRRKLRDRPLVLIVSNIHYLPDNTEGQQLLDLLQQRAELWAASGLVTIVFTSDQYRTTEMLRLHATRLQVMNIQDIAKDKAVRSLGEYREAVFKEKVQPGILDEVYRLVGGRLLFLDLVARSNDMLKAARSICEKEKRWLLCNTWILGAEMDPKAEDQQDFCMAAMILAKALVEMEKNPDAKISIPGLPGIPIHKAQELMTFPDFIRKLDQMNIIAIDADAVVRADSVPMQNAFRAVCEDPGFEEHARATQARLDQLESLGRTTELMLKDLGNGEYEVRLKGNSPGGQDTILSIHKKSNPED